MAVAAGCELQAPLILTDQDVMLELMKHNIQLNKLDGKATASILDWYVVTFAVHGTCNSHRCVLAYPPSAAACTGICSWRCYVACQYF